MNVLRREQLQLDQQVRSARRLRNIFVGGVGAVALTIGIVHANGLANDELNERAGKGLVALFGAAAWQGQRVRNLKQAQRDDAAFRAFYKLEKNA